MLDEAKKKGIKIDFKKLSSILGIPVVGTIAKKKKTLINLKNIIYDVCLKKIVPTPHIVKYLPIIEDSISLLSCEYPTIPYPLNRWVSLKLLSNDKKNN